MRTGFDPSAATDSRMDGMTSDGGDVGDGDVDNDTAADGEVDNDTAADGHGPVNDAPLDTTADGDVGVREGGSTVDFLQWTDLAITSVIQSTTGRFSASSELTATSSTTWEFDSGGDGAILWMGRNEYGRAYLVTRFGGTVPQGATLVRARFVILAMTRPGSYDALMVCVESTFQPVSLGSNSSPPGSLYCRRWPESGSLYVSDAPGAAYFSPDIAPLIQRIAVENNGGQIPENFTLQIWVSAAESVGDPYSLGVPDSTTSGGGKSVRLDLHWCE
ncbi:MAG: hypothetical protein JRH20_31255 [Deltaproteobacteria bacterium]|nr:hypothetical protein [Deltaproteobacteria bacterium]